MERSRSVTNLGARIGMCLPIALLLWASTARADSLSFTGSLASPGSLFESSFILTGSGSQSVKIQTWGFGGGTNAAGTLEEAG